MIIAGTTVTQQYCQLNCCECFVLLTRPEMGACALRAYSVAYTLLQGHKGPAQRLPDVCRLQAHAVHVWSRAAEAAQVHG